MAQRDDLGGSRVELREHDRGLVGLRAGGREEALLQPPRRDPRERLGELHGRERRIERRDVREPADLRDDRRVDLLVGVADRDGQDAAEEVEVLVAVGVLDPKALALGQDEGLLRSTGSSREA